MSFDPPERITGDDHYDSDHSICPYCRYKHHVESEDYSEDPRVEECSQCGMKFHLSQRFSVDHVTTPDCGLNGQPHEYRMHTISGRNFCKYCGRIEPLSESNASGVAAAGATPD